MSTSSLTPSSSASNSPVSYTRQVLPVISSPPPLHVPLADSRQAYSGYSFVFQTDAIHDGSKQYPLTPSSNSVRYLRSSDALKQDRYDVSHLVHQPWFFVSFNWTLEDGVEQTISRAALANSWQISLNKLVYFVSFLEEKQMSLSRDEVFWLADEFGSWNDRFLQLDRALGQLAMHQNNHTLPHFHPSPLLLHSDSSRGISSGFLDLAAWLASGDKLLQTPDRALAIEERLSPWRACQGYQIL